MSWIRAERIRLNRLDKWGGKSKAALPLPLLRFPSSVSTRAQGALKLNFLRVMCRLYPIVYRADGIACALKASLHPADESL